MATINRTWFKNRMREGAFLVKCDGKYSDDYAFDAAYNFFKEEEFKECPPDYFDDWYISSINISGDKEGTIEITFARCQYYSFKLKPIVETAAPEPMCANATPTCSIIKYSDRAIVVTGDTKSIKDTLKDYGGKFNSHLKDPATGDKLIGWIFSAKKQQQLSQLLGL